MNENEKQVMELIKLKNYLSTRELCEALHLSESTVRRVLTNLSDRGKILRYHGGAMSLDFHHRDSEVLSRYDDEAEKKDLIARKAAECVATNAVVILLGGTTVYKMCKYLAGKRITVITNSLLVFDALKEEREMTLLLLGGKYNSTEKELHGPMTLFSLKMLYADCLFMGATRIHPRIGFLTNDMESLEMYRLCLESSKTHYVLADSSKLGNVGSAVIASCDQIDYLITDDEMESSVVEEFQSNHLTVIQA